MIDSALVSKIYPGLVRNVTLVVLLSCCFIISALTLTSSVAAQEEGVEYSWELKKNKSGIQIYTSTVPGSKYKAVRSTTRLDARLESAIALIMDPKACPEWADMCKKSEVYEEISDTESYIYTYNNLPFPVKDRDVLAHVVWQVDPQSGRVSMFTKAVTDKMPSISKAIRLEKAVAQWHFTVEEEGTLLVENFAHIDPNGPTPAWLTNLLLVSSPYKTLIKMRKVLKSGRYDQHSVAFLKP